MENASAKTYRVATGAIGENGRFVIAQKPIVIGEAEMEKIKAALDGHLLKFQGTKTSSYDNSDDDRVEDSYDSYSFTSYGSVDAEKDSEYLLWVNGKLVGVLFTVTPTRGRDISRHAFFFDGSVAQSTCQGYSASHSSSHTYLEKVSLVPAGKGGAPETAYPTRFDQSEMYPSF